MNLLPNYLLCYIVLEARKLPVFPFLSPHSAHSHLNTSSNGVGSVVCHASQQYNFFQPELGRKVEFFASQGYPTFESAQTLMQAYSSMNLQEETFADRVRTIVFPALAPNSAVVLDQETPYGTVVCMSNGVELRMFGVYTQDYSLLVVTNVQNFEELLKQDYPGKFWIHRFQPKDLVQFVVFTRRVCARWFRWMGKTNLSGAASRFVALENLLFRGSFDDPSQELLG